MYMEAKALGMTLYTRKRTLYWRPFWLTALMSQKDARNIAQVQLRDPSHLLQDLFVIPLTKVPNRDEFLYLKPLKHSEFFARFCGTFQRDLHHLLMTLANVWAIGVDKIHEPASAWTMGDKEVTQDQVQAIIGLIETFKGDEGIHFLTELEQRGAEAGKLLKKKAVQELHTQPLV